MHDRTIMALSSLPFDVDQWKRLRSAVNPDQLLVVDPTDEVGLSAALESAEVVILPGDLDDRHLRAPNLKWVHCDHAGLTKSARPQVFERGLIVTGSAGRSAPALAEHALMFMLLLSSGYLAFYEAQKQRQWRGVPGTERFRALHGLTLGIIGMGNTGLELAARAQAFGMTVLGYRRRAAALPAGVDRMYCWEQGHSIDPILEQADIVALVVSLSDATFHLVGQPELRRMKKTAFLVNMSRGAIVDEAALIEALQRGDIAGAGLDVFETEPLPTSSPLWSMPNVLVTPHFTAPIPGKSERSLEMILENLRRYRAGEPMLNRLTPDDVFTPRQ